MNIQDRKGLKQSAAASLNGARSEKAIVTIYFAITTVLSVLVMVANLILDHFIAGTGGLSNLGSRTMPDFFGLRYKSKALRLVAAAIVFVFLIPYTASLYNGLSRLFGMAFDIDYAVCVIVMAILTGIYVIAGGYMATAINDFIQGIIMIVGICAVIGAVSVVKIYKAQQKKA